MLFHSYIKHRKVSRPLVGPIRLTDGSLTDNPNVVAECFVSSSHSVFSSAQPSNSIVDQTCSSNIGPIKLSVHYVEKVLRELVRNSGMRGNGLHPRFLKVIRSNLFSKHLLIFKKSSRYDPPNYRLISLIYVK